MVDYQNKKVFYKDKFVPFDQANLSIASSAVLYGLSVYTVFPINKTSKGMAIFSLEDHFNRLVDSAHIIGMDSFFGKWTYEKFLDQDFYLHNFITMGQIYKAVIDRERNFGYRGEDVEAIPHVTDEILDRIKAAGEKEKSDVVVIELGGTAGEYQNALYYEASRILSRDRKNTVVHVHVSYLPTPSHLGEPKTKPTQLSVKMLNSMGIQHHWFLYRKM